MGSSAGQQSQQAPGGKGTGQSAPGGKGNAGQPMQPPPGGKGQPQGQPMPPIPEGAGQPMPGGKGKAPGTPVQGQPGQSDLQRAVNQGGKGAGYPSMMQGGSDQYHSNGGSSMQPQQPMPGGKGAGQPQQSPGMKGGPANGLQPMPGNQGQLMPGGKGAGQMDPRMIMQGGTDQYHSNGGSSMQPQQIGMQPFHNATTNNYNAPPAARANAPYGPPGTNGNPAAFGMQPGQTGFGFGNGAARVPDTDHLTAGQFNPAIHPQMQQQPQPTAQAAQNQAFRGLPMYQRGNQ